MAYRIKPDGELWSSGVFCVPKSVAEKSLKFAGELQLKALIYLLSESGIATPAEIAKACGCDENDAEECLDFWRYEGVLIKDGEEEKPAESAPAPAPEAEKPQLEALPMPSLTPRDIVRICGENPELANLLRSAETILASSLSASMKSNIINMVTYYGLPVSVVITLLEYYKTERDSGRNVTTRKLQSIAKKWANEDVNTIEEASLKLLEMSEVDTLWLKVIDLCGFDYKQMQSAQRKMLERWRADFSNEMVFFACNTMKKYTDEDKQSLKAVDSVLKEWKRKGLKTPDEVKNQPKAKEKPATKGKLQSKPSYDLEEIKKRSELNDDFDI